MTLLISLLLLTAVFFALTGSDFAGWLGTELRIHPIVILVWKAFQWPAVILFISIACSLIYYCGPDVKDRHWHWVTPGFAFGAFVRLVGLLGFRIYLHFLNRYSVTYGSLGAVMILMVWLYLVGLAYLLGGTINAEIERAAKRGTIAARSFAIWISRVRVIREPCARSKLALRGFAGLNSASQ